MKKWKKYLAFVLTFLLVMGVCIPAFAAVEHTGFSDVAANAWYAEAVAYCREHGLMSGTTDTSFEPESPLTRAMLVTVLYRSAGSPTVTGANNFRDTAAGAYYADAVLWASQKGLVSGYENGLFGTDDPVSREQMASIFWRYAGSPSATGTVTFRDGASIASYAADAVSWTAANNIMGPVSSGTFAPKSSATRAQVASALMHYAQSQETAPSGNARVLVAYFSRYGNTDYGSGVDAATSASIVVRDNQRQGTTELIARMIADQTGGDLHLIETADIYPTDFDAVVSQNHRESADGVRPALVSSVDVSGYDVIFIGYPVWASTTPTPVLSFLEGLGLSGKTVVPFCTHDGYGAGNSYFAVSEASKGAAVKQGLAVEAADAASSERTVVNWLNGLQLPSGGGTANAQQSQGETAVRITIGGQVLDGVLYDSSMARQFIAQLPQTITMSNYGGREVYGSIDREITVEGEGQLRFDDGDITYCSANNTAAIFYSQSSHPDLTMAVYPIGKVTSDLSIFPDLPSRVEITFEAVS